MRKLAYFAAVALLCTGIAVAQSTSSPDQSQSSSPSAQQPSSADQNQATPSSSDQNQASPSTGAASTSDQNAQTGAAANDQTGNAKAGKKLPQTASPLPFLSLLGMGMMGAGGLRRYLKR